MTDTPTTDTPTTAAPAAAPADENNLPVTRQALLRRAERALRPGRLVSSRGRGTARFHAVVDGSGVVQRVDDLVAFARAHGLLKPWETLVG